MYYYIFEQPKTKSQKKLQEKIRLLLDDIKIVGEVVKANPIQRPAELAVLGIKKGYNTIVALGSDAMVNRVAEVVAKYKSTLGFIPLNEKSALFKLLGVKNWEEACQILPARMVEVIDLGKVGEKKFFLTSVKIASTIPLQSDPNVAAPLPIILDFGTYQVEEKLTDLDIYNGDLYSSDNRKIQKTFQDGLLEILFTKEFSQKETLFSKIFQEDRNLKADSIFHATNVFIQEGNFAIISGNEIIGKTPVQVSVIPRSIKVILGKHFKTRAKNMLKT